MIERLPGPTEPASGGRLSTTIRFTLPARPEIVAAALCGDFTAWADNALPMHRRGEDFVVAVELENGHRYRFKYLVNGVTWENDWAADDYETNADGAHESVVDLTDVSIPTAATATC